MIKNAMISRASVYRISIPIILAIFLLSSLLDTLSQESFACNSTLQFTSNNIDDNSSLDKKKKSNTLVKILLPREPSHIRSHVSVIHPSWIISHISFPHFLRAPPLG
jgi:hypothetical protein